MYLRIKTYLSKYVHVPELNYYIAKSKYHHSIADVQEEHVLVCKILSYGNMGIFIRASYFMNI